MPPSGRPAAYRGEGPVSLVAHKSGAVPRQSDRHLRLTASNTSAGGAPAATESPPPQRRLSSASTVSAPAAFGVRDRRRRELGELREPVPVLGGNDCSVARRSHQPPEPTLDEDRRADYRDPTEIADDAGAKGKASALNIDPPRPAALANVAPTVTLTSGYRTPTGTYPVC